ncbi:hypothetical protein ABZ851_15025 [Streptomyces sp. NPDC047049]|uniref:hypothetical protein n=1 Tax=Streptomyces sp. NPDC047049 TaxID=3156688 RepID=UPI0033D24A24
MDTPQSPNHFDLSGSAKPVALAPPLAGDPYVWFVTGAAEIGRFKTAAPHDSKVFPPGYPSPRQAGTLATRIGTIWTYAHNSDDGRVVTCTASGDYTTGGTGPNALCLALAFGSDGDEKERLVATNHGRKGLLLIEMRKGAVAYSGNYEAALYGLAIGAGNPTEYWITCPEKKRLLTFDAATGKFSPHPVELDFEPRAVAVSEAMPRMVWVATTTKKIARYNADDPGTVYVDTPAVPGRLLVLADGALWFTMPDADQIGWIEAGGTEVAGTISTGKGSRPSGLAVDRNGTLWTSLEGTGQMFRVSEYQLIPLSGQGQNAGVGTDFPQPLVVKAERLDQDPQEGAAITFTIVGDEARFPGDKRIDERTTGKDGKATSALLHAESPGTFSVTAEWKEEGGFTRFENLTVQAVVGNADSTRYVSGAGQHVDPETDFPEPLRVKVVDKNGAPVPDVLVSFRITPSKQASFPNGKPSANVKSDKVGIATAPTLTAGEQSASLKIEVFAANTEAGTVLREYIN